MQGDEIYSRRLKRLLFNFAHVSVLCRRLGGAMDYAGGGQPSGEAPTDPLRSFWQRRFYDFNVWSAKKRIEKLNFMQRNPVKRGLVMEPQRWEWSSYRLYQPGEESVCTPDREPN